MSCTFWKLRKKRKKKSNITGNIPQNEDKTKTASEEENKIVRRKKGGRR